MGNTDRHAARLGLGVAALATAAMMISAPATAASGSSFSVAEVVEEVQRQLAAADQPGGLLHIDDASLELALVEGLGAKADSFAVPGADFTPGSKEGGVRPPLKQRLVLDLAAGRRTKSSGDGSAGVAAGAAAGQLTAAILQVKSAVQQALAADSAFDLKKLTLDFDFALDRDNRGQPSLIIHARERRIDAPGVQGVKVRFAANGK